MKMKQNAYKIDVTSPVLHLLSFLPLPFPVTYSSTSPSTLFSLISFLFSVYPLFSIPIHLSLQSIPFSHRRRLLRRRSSLPLGTEMRLIFAHHSSINKVDALGSSLESITNTTAASGLDFHFERKLLFWSDTETRKVNKLAKPIPFPLPSFLHLLIHLLNHHQFKFNSPVTHSHYIHTNYTCDTNIIFLLFNQIYQNCTSVTEVR